MTCVTAENMRRIVSTRHYGPIQQEARDKRSLMKLTDEIGFHVS